MVGLMIFFGESASPFVSGRGRKPGQIQFHTKIDAIKGHRGSEGSLRRKHIFVDAILNEFLSVSQKIVQGKTLS